MKTEGKPVVAVVAGSILEFLDFRNSFAIWQRPVYSEMEFETPRFLYVFCWDLASVMGVEFFGVMKIGTWATAPNAMNILAEAGRRYSV